MKIKNILSDFDHVAYRHTEHCFKRQHHAAAVVAKAYFGISYEDALDKTAQSWNNHKNGFYFALKDHSNLVRNVGFDELYRQQASQSQDAQNGIRCGETIRLINEISKKYPFIFASHSATLSVQFMGQALGINSALLEYGTYGIDRLGENGNARKDDMNSDVYPWLCRENGFCAQETVMIEDTAINLKGAKMKGLQTIHIHGGERIDEPYIDYRFETMREALLFLRNQMRP